MPEPNSVYTFVWWFLIDLILGWSGSMVTSWCRPHCSQIVALWTSSPKSAAWTSTNQHKPAQRNENDVSFEILGILWNPKQLTRLFQLVNAHSATLTFQFVAFDLGWSFDWTQVGMMPSWRSFLRKWRWCVDLRFFYTWFGWTWRNVISHIFTRTTTAWRFPTIE